MACASCGSKYPPVRKRAPSDPIITYTRSTPKPKAVRGVIKSNGGETPPSSSNEGQTKQPTE